MSTLPFLLQACGEHSSKGVAFTFGPQAVVRWEGLREGWEGVAPVPTGLPGTSTGVPFSHSWLELPALRGME